MQSFRTELENPLVEKDILELEKKIHLFKEGKINEEKFRSLRLARGVYGQRQQGVQMVRIKLPYGRLSVKQLLKISDVSDEYATGNLHLTTRQDIQIHYVSLDRTPELWAQLEEDDITLREACGNTVRNITASPFAGISAEEPFDVSPYAHEMFRYFLRNPICQDMGRKIKMAFSSGEKDDALTFMHDLGFIPRIQNGQRGFKIVVGGGLGAQPFIAKTAFEFLETEKIIPYTEAVLRVFDRYGERNSRHKARLKFLLQKIGFEEFTRLVQLEQKALPYQVFPVDETQYQTTIVPSPLDTFIEEPINPEKFRIWVRANTFAQKQTGYTSVAIKVLTGDMKTPIARELAAIVQTYAADDMRITINQGLLLKFVEEKYLPNLFNRLNAIGLAEPGFNSTADITTCPGTDTCNLGISNSTSITQVLEEIIATEYPDLVFNSDINIKISGCMNSCGQHLVASIGFHGSSLKAGANVLPALQVMLGGGQTGKGETRIADKIIKIPSKRGPDILRTVLIHYDEHALEGEYFNDFYQRLGKDHFYQLLKPLADLATLQQNDFIDWGQDMAFETAIGVGECAGVMIDLVSTLLFEAEEKKTWAQESFTHKKYSDSIYHSYSVFISAAKALLLDKQINCNTQNGIINDFDAHFVQTGLVEINTSFRELVLQINQENPSQTFAENYLHQAQEFLTLALAYRAQELVNNTNLT